jgi:hypothetical protein
MLLVPFVVPIGLAYYFCKTYAATKSPLRLVLAVVYAVALNTAVWLGSVVVYYVQTAG